jgi:hypothetical protein
MVRSVCMFTFPAVTPTWAALESGPASVKTLFRKAVSAAACIEPLKPPPAPAATARAASSPVQGLVDIVQGLLTLQSATPVPDVDQRMSERHPPPLASGPLAAAGWAAGAAEGAGASGGGGFSLTGGRSASRGRSGGAGVGGSTLTTTSCFSSASACVLTAAHLRVWDISEWRRHPHPELPASLLARVPSSLYTWHSNESTRQRSRCAVILATPGALCQGHLW